MTEWISVEDGLPEEGDLVIGFMSGISNPVDSTYLYEGQWTFGYVYLPEKGKVTHWQPLPDPPEVDDAD